MLSLIFKYKGRLILFIICPFFLSGCNSKPDLDYFIAQRALSAAKSEGAGYKQCSSRNYYEAERLFALGKKYYIAKDQASAKKYLSDSVKLSEKSEEEAIFCNE